MSLSLENASAVGIINDWSVEGTAYHLPKDRYVILTVCLLVLSVFCCISNGLICCVILQAKLYFYTFHATLFVLHAGKDRQRKMNSKKMNYCTARTHTEIFSTASLAVLKSVLKFTISFLFYVQEAGD